MGMAFDSPEAQQLNREIFETVYFAALEESCRLAQEEGAQSGLCGPISLSLMCYSSMHTATSRKTSTP